MGMNKERWKDFGIWRENQAYDGIRVRPTELVASLGGNGSGLLWIIFVISCEVNPFINRIVIVNCNSYSVGWV